MFYPEGTLGSTGPFRPREVAHEGFSTGMDLEVGNRIVGMRTPEELEKVVTQICTFVAAINKNSDKRGVDTVVEQFMRHQKKTPEFARRRKFHGRLGGYRVVVLPPPEPFELAEGAEFIGNHHLGYFNITPGRGVSFLTETEMHSTGRGLVGLIKSKTSVWDYTFRGKREDWPASHDLYMKNQRIEKKSTELEIDQLLAEAIGRGEALYRTAISSPYHAGLPTLGKR